MSQQHPTQPVYGYAPPPQQPKKKGKKWLYILIGAAVFLVIIVAASSNGSKGTSDDTSGTSNAKTSHTSAPKDTGKKADKPAQSPVEAFQAYVGKHGSTAERAAVKHVTKVQGADEKNDILDQADIYTDFSGDLVSGDAASGKLIASAFRDWQSSRGKESKNGLVTVYNKSGEMLSNGKY